MAKSYPNGQKTLWEKEKLLVMSNFSFFPQGFQKARFPGASKGAIVWERVKLGRNGEKSHLSTVASNQYIITYLSLDTLILYHTIPTFNNPEKEAFLRVGNLCFLFISHNVFKDKFLKKGYFQISYLQILLL